MLYKENNMTDENLAALKRLELIHEYIYNECEGNIFYPPEHIAAGLISGLTSLRRNLPCPCRKTIYRALCLSWYSATTLPAPGVHVRPPV